MVGQGSNLTITISWKMISTSSNLLGRSGDHLVGFVIFYLAVNIAVGNQYQRVLLQV